MKKAEVKQLMSSYDIDGSGKIEFTDFVDISELEAVTPAVETPAKLWPKCTLVSRSDGQVRCT